MPNNKSAKRYCAGCTSFEKLSLKKKFFKKTPFFDQKIVILTQFLNFPSKTPVGFRSYNCHREPYAKFQPNPTASLEVDHIPHPLRIDYFWSYRLAAGPVSRARKLGGEIAPTTEYDSVARVIWHTSSKGMPRHAYGRWALVTVCGVDVSHVNVVRTKRSAYVKSKRMQILVKILVVTANSLELTLLLF